MISIINENMVIGPTINNFSTAPGKSCLVSKDSRKKVSNGDIWTSIILTQQNQNQPMSAEATKFTST
jgi:hypothetical protein